MGTQGTSAAGWRCLLLAAAATLALLAACGSTTTVTLTPTSSTSTVTVTLTAPARSSSSSSASSIDRSAAEAVARRVFPGDAQGGYGECDHADDLAACPLTPKLAARLLQHPTSNGGGGGAAPLCRCQAVSPDLAISTDTVGDHAVAHVGLFGGQVKIDLVVVGTAGGPAVDDTTCTGKDPVATSIYAAVVTPCA